MDEFTEVTSQGWGSRIMDSIKGVAVGGILFVVSFPLLFWNEGRAVKTAKKLAEGASAVVSVAADKVDAANEKKLVHVTGEATTEATLSDEEFGVSATAIKLLRKVEMYQWKEKKSSRTRKKVGGGSRTETTYSYSRVWSESPIDSSRFKKPAGHENPGTMAYRSKEAAADDVRLGAFRLSKSLIGKIAASSPLRVDAAKLPEALKGKVTAGAGGYYVGQNPAAPAVGDLKITFAVVKPQTVSLISRQIGDTFEPYPARVGGTIEMLEAGTHSAESMFEAAERANVAMTWILRIVGFILMAVGIGLVFHPLAVLADVLPFLGDLLRLGIGLFAGLIALSLSLVTIAIAWLFYRPVLAIILIAIAVGAFLAVKQMGKAKKASAAPAEG